MDNSHVTLITPFDYFKWKKNMVIQLISRGLCIATMGTKNESNSTLEKCKYFKILDEAFGIICLNISRDILFHVDSLTTLNEVCLRPESFFGKTGEKRGHQLENDLITLNPNHFETIQ